MDVLTRLYHVVLYEGVGGPAVQRKVGPSIYLEGARIVEEPERDVSQRPGIIYRGSSCYPNRFTDLSKLGE
jgi:hypothetical protein